MNFWVFGSMTGLAMAPEAPAKKRAATATFGLRSHKLRKPDW
jgi:hypothetical protein